MHSTAGSSPAVEAGAFSRTDLAHVVARYVRRRCSSRVQMPATVHDGANALGHSPLENLSDESPLEEEEARLIAITQLLEAQLLQCLLHVRLNPQEMPSQPELPGDVYAGAGTIIITTTPTQLLVAKQGKHEKASSSGDSTSQRVDREKPLSEKETHSRPATTTTAAIAHSPPPRQPTPPIPTDKKPTNADNSRKNKAEPLHTQDPAPSASPPSPLSTSRSTSGTKATELYYAYTHQHLPPPPRASSSHRTPQTLSRSRNDAPVIHVPPAATVMVAENQKGKQENEEGAMRSQRSRQPDEKKQGRRSASDRRGRRRRHPGVNSAEDNAEAQQGGHITRNEVQESPIGVPNAADEGKTRKERPAPSRMRRGAIRPLMPIEVAAAIGSWPSRIVQYTLATKLAKTALSNLHVDTEVAGTTGAVESRAEQQGRVSTAASAAASSSLPPPSHDSAPEVWMGSSTELDTLLQRIRDVLLYTNIAAGMTEENHGDVAAGALSVSFPSFARFYLSPSTVPTIGGQHDVDGAAPGTVVIQHFLSQLTDALVSAAAVPYLERDNVEEDEVEEEGDDHSDRDRATRNNGRADETSKEADQREGSNKGDEKLTLTGDMVKDIGLLLKRTPTILAGSSSPPPPLTEGLQEGKQVCSALPRSARSVVRRALRRLLHLSPSWYDATTCSTPLVVGVLRRYKQTSAEAENEKRNGSVEKLSIRFIPAVDVMTPSTIAECATAFSKRKEEEESRNQGVWQGTATTPYFYNALLIEVSGDDVVYSSESEYGNHGGDNTDADVLPIKDEKEAKTISQVDVHGPHRRQQQPPSPSPRSGRESSVEAEHQRSGLGNNTTQRCCLSRRQCVVWQQLLTLAQFVHVAGTPAQVETTARYVALAVRHRREARQQQRQQHQRSLSSPSVVLQSNSSASSAPPSIAESAMPVSVPAFFFTLTQMSVLAEEAATATRALLYEDDDMDGMHGEHPPAQADAADAQKRMNQHNNEETKERSNKGSSSAPSPAQSSNAQRRGIFNSGSGFGLRALLGWRAATTVPPPLSPTAAPAPTLSPTRKPVSQPRKLISSSQTSNGGAPPVDVMASSTDDIIMKWMHDTLIPIFYETTVTCSEAGEVAGTGTTASLDRSANAAGNAATSPVGGKTDVSGSSNDTRKNNNGSSGRRHRYRLRRQRMLLGRVQAITVAMVLREFGNHSSSNSGDVTSTACSSNVIHMEGEAVAMTESQLVSYLMLNQLFFEAAVPPPEVINDAAGDERVEVAADVHLGPRRARSAPSATYQTDALNVVESFTSLPPRRAVSTTPHRTNLSAQKLSPQKRRVCFREDTTSNIPTQRLAPLPEPAVADRLQGHSGTTDHAGVENSTAAGTTTTHPCLLSPSPKSILKSGRRYKTEKLVRNSAPAASVVPFRSLFLWRWLAAEVVSPTHAAQTQTAVFQEKEPLSERESAVSLRVTDLSPMLHISSDVYLAEVQTLAVRVACDVVAALLLAGPQAEQYVCHHQLQKTCHTMDEQMNSQKDAAVTSTAGSGGVRTSKEKVERSPPLQPLDVSVLEARNAKAFQCDDILPLAKGVAEAVIRAALAPVVYEAGVPQQLWGVVQPGDLAEATSSEDDETDAASTSSVEMKLGKRSTQACLYSHSNHNHIGGGGGGGSISVASSSISVLSPTLSPDAVQRFKILSAVCIYHVQRETLESATRPLDLALRRLTWCLAQHRLSLLCQPLLEFWRADEIVTLANIAAAVAVTSASASTSSAAFKNSVEAHTLHKKCLEAQHRLCMLVGQVLQLYERCFCLPHLLTGAGAPHAVELSLGDSEKKQEGEGEVEVNSFHAHGTHVQEALHLGRYTSTSPLDKDPLTPKGVANSVGLRVPSQQQQVTSNRNDFVPLCFGETTVTQKASMTTFTKPLEASISTSQPLTQQQQLSSLPNGSCVAVLGAWKFMERDVDNSLGLHSSLCCDWCRSMWLSSGASGGEGNIKTAARDFAAAVSSISSISPVRPPPPSMVLRTTTGRDPSSQSEGNSSSQVMNMTSAGPHFTVVPFSPPSALLSTSNLTPPAQASKVRGGEESTTSGSPPVVATDTAQQQQQHLHSVSSTSLPNPVSLPQAAITPPSKQIPEKVDGGIHETDVADGTRSPILALEGGSPLRPRYSSSWLKLLAHQDQQRSQPQPHQMELPVMSSHSSFLTFNVVTPLQQRFHVPIFGANKREEEVTSTAITRRSKKTKEAQSAASGFPPPSTQPPTPVAPSDRPLPAGEATIGEESSKTSESSAEHTRRSASQTPSHFAVQLRMGKVVESRLLRPFVEQMKRLLVGSLLQNWVQPRWRLLVELGVHAVRQAEREAQTVPATTSQQRMFSSTQTEYYHSTHEPRNLKEMKHSPSGDTAVRHPHLYIKDDVTVPAAALLSSFDALAPINEKESTKPGIPSGSVTAVAPSLPPPPQLICPPPSCIAAGRADDHASKNRDDEVNVMKAKEKAALQARMRHLQDGLDEITQVCRDLTTAAKQYELTLILEEPTPSPLLAIKKDPADTKVDSPLAHGNKHAFGDTSTLVCSPTVTLPTTSGSPSATSPPSPSLHLPQLPTPVTAASLAFLRKMRDERERIVALCKRMSNIVAWVESQSTVDEDNENEQESPQPDSFSRTRSGGEKKEGNGFGRGGVLLGDSPLHDQTTPLGSLSQGIRGPPCPTTFDSSVVAKSDPQHNHRGSCPISAGPSQLFNPLHEPIRRSSTALTFTSVPAPMMGTPSVTITTSPISSADDDEAIVLTSNGFLLSVPAVQAFTKSPLSCDLQPLQHHQHPLQRHPSNEMGGPAPRALAPTSLYKDAPVIIAKETAVGPKSSTEVASTAAAHPTRHWSANNEVGEMYQDEVSAIAAALHVDTKAQESAEEQEKEVDILRPTELPRKLSSPILPAIGRRDCAQQTVPEDIPLRNEASTQVPAPALDPKQLQYVNEKDDNNNGQLKPVGSERSGVHNRGSISDGEQKSKKRMSSADSQRSVKTAEVTPYNHQHHHSSKKESRSRAVEGASADRDVNPVVADEKSSNGEEDDDYSSSTLSPVSEHSSNRHLNAVLSGCSSPMLSAVFLSSMATAADSLAFDSRQQQQQQQVSSRGPAGDTTADNNMNSSEGENDAVPHSEVDAGQRVAEWLRPASPPPAPQVARCISLGTQSLTPLFTPKRPQGKMEGEVVRGATVVHQDSKEGEEDVDELETYTDAVGDDGVGYPLRVDTTVAQHAEGGTEPQNDNVSRSKMETTGKAQTPNSARRTTRRSSAALPSSSPFSPLQEHTPTRGSEAAVTALADLQQRLGESNSTVVELRQKLERAGADAHTQAQLITHLQQQLETTQAALRRTVASQETKVEEMQLRPPLPLSPVRCSVAVNTVDTSLQRPLLSPSVSSTPLKTEVTVLPPSPDGDLTTTTTTAQKVEVGVQVSSKEEESAQTASTSGANSAFTAARTSAERRVLELEADMRNAAFRIEQWKALLEAERHARAVQVDQLAQQLESEQRRLHRGRSSSRSRSMSPLDGGEKPLATVGSSQQTLTIANQWLRFFDEEGSHPTASPFVAHGVVDGHAVRADAEEQRLTAALTQQAEELKGREEDLKQRVTHVLDRLHATEARLEEQQQQSRKDAAAAAVAWERERTKLAQRVAQLEGELESVRPRDLLSAAQMLSNAHTGSNDSSGTEVRMEDAGVQTEDITTAPDGSTSTATVEQPEHAEKEAAYIATQQHLQAKLFKEEQKCVDIRALHMIELEAMRRDLQEKTREAQTSKELWMDEQEAHERTRVTLATTQSAVAAAQSARTAEETLFHNSTAAWWAAMEKLATEWTQEKAALMHDIYAEHFYFQGKQLYAAMESTKETETVQQAAVSTLRTALDAVRADAAAREGELQRKMEEVKRDAEALVRTHAATTTQQQQQSAQERCFRAATAAWWDARSTCTAKWTEEKFLFISDLYERQLHVREKEQQALVANMRNPIAVHVSAIASLHEEILSTHREEDELKERLHAQERAREELTRVSAAYTAAQEALRTDIAQFVCSVGEWWTSRESCLVAWAETKTSLLEKAQEAIRQTLVQKQEEVVDRLVGVSTAHEAAAEALRRQLADAQQVQHERTEKLRREEEAHARTMAALQATQAASDVVRKVEAAQQSRFQRNTASWWSVHEGCISDWVEAKVQLLQFMYELAHLRLGREVPSKQLCRDIEMQANAAAAAVTATPLKEKSPTKTENANVSRRTRNGGSPDVVIMSLEDPLGLRYELQRKSRRIHSLEEQVRQLEATHAADLQAVTTLQAVLQRERRDHVSPLSAIRSASSSGVVIPPSCSNRAWLRPPSVSLSASTPFRTPTHRVSDDISSEATHRTPSRSPGTSKSRRLTPSEYRQRFAEI